jgi:orotate phosphoribosyltransferase-like protein
MSASPPADRTPAEIRASIEQNRAELGAAVERLRAQATELADWRSHLRRHRTEVLVGAAVAGFVLGGGIAAMVGRLRRRR